MTKFFLYRLMVERSLYRPLLADQSLSNGDIIRAAIEEKPSHTLKNGQVWRIGNIEQFAESSIFFALGRITKSKRQLYDEVEGNFVEEALDEAPHTYVIVDLELQVCAIGHKTIVSRTPKAIANNLQRILNASHQSDPENEPLRFVLSLIEDPQEFLDSIASAYQVSSFTIYFSRPNPFDVNEQFVKPMERYLQQAGGQEGETTIKGEGLRPEVLQEMVRSAAATGNTARARIRSQRARTGGPETLDRQSGSRVCRWDRYRRPKARTFEGDR